jgi:4-alpha-glucanotransferase
LAEATDELTDAVRGGLARLGVERLVLAIHDQSFPATPDEDIGRGSPYGRGARALFHFLDGQGFDGVQLGPQGDTSLRNPSPYDGALFSKSPMSIALATLAEDPAWEPLAAGLLESVRVAAPTPGRVQYQCAWHAGRRTLGALHARLVDGPLRALFGQFLASRGPMLEADADFAALTAENGTDDWRVWPAVDREWRDAARQAEVRARRAAERERHLFGQFVLDEQHRALRRNTPLALFGDLQIGFSHRDLWSRRSVFRGDYLMGAPPSRTNPEGQPWGYPVLDPGQYGGAAQALVEARVDRLLEDFDGLRIDHPHGLVCPWVYRAGDPDPALAVQHGARLFCSPNLPDHPALAALAIPSAEQLSRDPGIPRYADAWVHELREDQVGRYGILFDAIMARVAAAGRRTSDVVCEVLSTWPYPLRRVMERHGLGRFCVTQKADLTRADDVYRSENASPRDWIMIGNHDTRPIWLLAEGWHGTAAGTERALHLARRLMPDGRQARLARWIAADRRHLCQAMFAELFASRARRISVFFADFFGSTEIYNRPGVVAEENWTLRLPGDFAALFTSRVAEGEACNLPLALALATPGKAPELLAAARRLTPTLDGEIVGLLG